METDPVELADVYGFFFFMRTVAEKATRKIAVGAKNAQPWRIASTPKMAVKIVAMLRIPKRRPMLFAVAVNMVKLKKFNPRLAAARAKSPAIRSEDAHLYFVNRGLPLVGMPLTQACPVNARRLAMPA